MELSKFVAQTIGIIYVALAIGVFNEQYSFKKVFDAYEKSQALTMFASFMVLILGMIIVTYHNVWAKDWTVLVTLIGWGALIKGVLLLSFPKELFRLKNFYRKNEKTWAAVMLGLGLVFGYFGFFS